MTTLSETLLAMFTEPTAHHMCDSGGIYGRSYQTNTKRDLNAEPSATLILHSDGWAEVTVSMFHMLNSTLELDDLCKAYNAIPCNDWDGGFAISTAGQEWLDENTSEIHDPWNTCNWENSFDQVIQARPLDINQEEYVLISVHGGCDVRSGYTDAKLFKVEDSDYFMFDDAMFVVNDPDEPEYKQRSVDYRSGEGLEIYHESGETEPFSEAWVTKLYPFNTDTISGDSNAVCH